MLPLLEFDPQVCNHVLLFFLFTSNEEHHQLNPYFQLGVGGWQINSYVRLDAGRLRRWRRRGKQSGRRRWESGWQRPCHLNRLNDMSLLLLGRRMDVGVRGWRVGRWSLPERPLLIFFFSFCFKRSWCACEFVAQATSLKGRSFNTWWLSGTRDRGANRWSIGRMNDLASFSTACKFLSIKKIW